MARPMPLPAFEQWLAGHPPATAVADAPAATLPLAEIELQALWHRMRSTGGLDIRDRMYHLRNYRQCFVAREALELMTRELKVNRAEATQIGRRMVALGWMRHVLNEHD